MMAGAAVCRIGGQPFIRGTDRGQPRDCCAQSVLYGAQQSMVFAGLGLQPTQRGRVRACKPRQNCRLAVSQTHQTIQLSGQQQPAFFLEKRAQLCEGVIGQG